MIEHDRLTLSYDKLSQLREQLGVRMSELFAEEQKQGAPPRHPANDRQPPRRAAGERRA